jgi:cardiolipin synthase
MRRGRIPRSVRHRLEPPISRTLRPQPLIGIWLKVRRVLWSPTFWLALMILAIGAGREGWAVVAAGFAFFAYLTYTEERAPQYGLEKVVAVGTPAFTDSLSGLAGAPYEPGNELRLLNNGNAFYPAMLDAVRAARYSVTMEAYIYWDGEIGKEMAQALAERSKSGVTVKLLLDAVGSTPIGAEILEILEAGGCQLAWFNPLRWWNINKLNNRTHRKSLVIDGTIAFTGGAGIADHWMGDAEDDAHWRDLMVKIHGPAAIPLQTGFAQNWLETTGEVVSGPDFFPPALPAGESWVQTVLSSPKTGASVARLTHFFALACARRSILIANPYFVPDPIALKLFADAIARGVAIDVIVAGHHNDNWLARHNSVRLFGDLLDLGVRVYEYNRTMLHQKTMVVDSLWATVGTTNFDNRSFALNEESNVCFTDAALVAELEAVTRADMARAELVRRDAWQRRSVFARAQETVASLLEHQV